MDGFQILVENKVLVRGMVGLQTRVTFIETRLRGVRGLDVGNAIVWDSYRSTFPVVALLDV